MTNKPMLSADLRKALADFIEYSVPGPLSDDAMWYADKKALRALLDKPACVKCGDTGVVDDGELTHSAGGIPYECGPIKCVTDCPDCKPAAQHQGEPVAEIVEFGKGLKEVSWLKGRMPKLGIKLYAEQPDPVAVDAEILERFPEINFANYGQEEVEALQAWAFEAYEAIARLNGVKT